MDIASMTREERIKLLKAILQTESDEEVEKFIKGESLIEKALEDDSLIRRGVGEQW